MMDGGRAHAHGTDQVSDHATAWFAAVPSSVSAARKYTAVQLEQWGLVDEAGIAALVVSELTSNALRHAHSEFELELSHADRTVRIAVSDASVAPPVARAPAADSGDGRGLQIVAAVASAWGVEVRDDGKQVWVRFSEPRQPAT